MVMASAASDLKSYLATVTGEPTSALGRQEAAEQRLPLVLRGRYRLEAVRLFDHPLVLAVESDGVEPSTPAGYAAHLAAISDAVGGPVALVLHGLTSPTRARLVAARVPFIVPGHQLFLPMLLVDLRERMRPPVVPREAALGNVAQLVVLTHLQKQRMDGVSLAEAAGLLGYTPMMLTKAKDELEAAGLCAVRRVGRALRLAFEAEGRALWERALPRLSSPVVRSELVSISAHDARAMALSGALRAGLSALSDLTDLADGPVLTVASGKAALGRFDRAAFEDVADARLEVWRHAPELLARDGRVDALSLYLSLRDSPDERVQAALDDLLEMLPW
jgi:DNA-binding MarR family transcriptional regulator